MIRCYIGSLKGEYKVGEVYNETNLFVYSTPLGSLVQNRNFDDSKEYFLIEVFENDIKYDKHYECKLSKTKIKILEKINIIVYVKNHEDELDKQEWNLLSGLHKLDESFIDKYKDKVSWYNVEHFQELSKEFIDEHKQYLSSKMMI